MIDIIPSPVSLLKSSIKDKNTIYTVPRYNIPPKFDVINGNYDKTLINLNEFKKLFSKVPIYGKNGSGSIDGGDEEYSLIPCCGDFQIAHRDVWYKIRGFEESMVHVGYSDTNLQLKAYRLGINLSLIEDYDIFHQYHESRVSNYVPNCWLKYGLQFKNTKNPETWGFSKEEFKTHE